MRPFGNAVDLDLDFSQADRPGLVTAILANCGDAAEPSFWWAQSVGTRTAALLELVALTEQRDEISLSGRCTAGGCGESFGFELPIHALPVQGDAGASVVQLADGRALTVRCPTGDDLRRWRDARPPSRLDALRLMLDSLVVSGEASLDDEAALSTSIAALDPLVDFTVSCPCPACGTANEVSVDLETIALSLLARRQRGLVEEVHLLATQYGWTEAEVLALPAARRARYTALIEDRR